MSEQITEGLVVQIATAMIGDRDNEIERLQVENKQLREALREIRDFGHAPGCRSTVVPIYECGCYGRSQATIARAALGEGG